MCSRGEANNQNLSFLITEAGNGLSPVRPFAEAARFDTGRLLAMRYKAGASAACRHGVLQDGQTGHGRSVAELPCRSVKPLLDFHSGSGRETGEIR